MPLPRRRLASLLLLAPLAGVSRAQDDSARELRLHWEPGQFYLQESDMDTTTFLTRLGRKFDQTLRMRQTTSIRVATAPDGSREVKVSIDGLKGELLQDGLLNPFDADTIQNALPLLQKTIGRATGRSFIMVYDTQDHFQSVRGFQSMLPRQSPETDVDLTAIADAKQAAALYRRSLEMGLPKIPVRVGDKWISDEAVSFAEAGLVQVKLNGKFEEIVHREGRPQARLAFQGTMVTQTDADTKRSITLGEGSKLSGQVLFDLERRTVSHSTMQGVLNLLVDGAVLPVHQTVTTRLVAMKRAGR